MNTNDDVQTESQAQELIGRNTAQLSRRGMLKGSGAALAALGMIGAAGFGAPSTVLASAEENVTEHDQSGKQRIVLVHGAWADGTGWQHVIPLLERAGYPVIAVQNPLTSLTDDVATTKRVIDAEALLGPVVVVGHSYGGAVITGAAGNPNVKALVYLAAFAPKAGEPLGTFLDQYPSILGPALRPDTAGFLTIDRASFRQIFAADVEPSEARVMAAAQKPLASAIFGEAPVTAAWENIPSWYLVSKQDNAINPDLERFYAKRMGAKTGEIKASHVAFISHPQEIFRLIVKAARAVS